MEKRLHITNGDNATELMALAKISGEYLPWRDCLHQGPIPAHLPLPELSQIRADYLQSIFLPPGMDIQHDMQQRDQMLTNLEPYQQLILWFEHDLYDQLQLLQILDTLPEPDSTTCQLKLICINHFPGVEPFHGLGQLNPQQLASLEKHATPITREQLAIAKAGWKAVRCPNPLALLEYLQQDLTPLPYMRAAIIRLMQEYPSIENGLNRTEQQTLQQLKRGPLDPITLFCGNQEMEEARYLGDACLWDIIKSFTTGTLPLLKTVTGKPFSHLPFKLPKGEFRKQSLQLTELGHKILEGERDRVQDGHLDYWIGGVHLGEGDDWRWCAEDATLINHKPSQKKE